MLADDFYKDIAAVDFSLDLKKLQYLLRHYSKGQILAQYNTMNRHIYFFSDHSMIDLSQGSDGSFAEIIYPDKIKARLKKLIIEMISELDEKQRNH